MRYVKRTASKRGGLIPGEACDKIVAMRARARGTAAARTAKTELLSPVELLRAELLKALEGKAPAGELRALALATVYAMDLAVERS